MDFPNFHDGDFHGIRLEPDKTAIIFLRSAAKRPYILVLKGVERLALGGVKEGNIILDLVFRNASDATPADVVQLYDVDETWEQASKILDNLRKEELQILELNPSYGADGLFLFESFEIKECTE